ncbi:MAG: hypothetical protein K0U93_22175 [Gammaproteobacteria bacterium]|nr:hypothetical protein [Gammaproteobacteria bacterium]
MSQHYSEPTSLDEALERYGREAFLLTTGGTGPHTSTVNVQLNAHGLQFEVGDSASKNMRERPGVSLLWPAADKNGYNVIINGETTRVANDSRARPYAQVTITKAVLHRAGPAPVDHRGPCKSDCLPLAYTT